MSTLNSNASYLTLQLLWGREDYRHQIGFNVQHPDYVITELFHKGHKLNTPPFLYKYYRPNENSLNCLNENYLYFSDPKNFGDEYDCLISDDDYVNQIIEDSDFIRENLGVCCFCTIPDEDQMWDYYAEGFQGFVIKYKNDANFLPYRCGADIKSHILYLTDNGPNNPNLIETLNSIKGKHIPDVVKGWQNQILFQHELCRKRIRYSFEKEYRVINFSSTDLNRRIPVKRNNIDSIYIGNKMKKEYLDELIEVLKGNKKIKILIVSHDYKNQCIKFNRVKNISQLLCFLGQNK